MMADRALFLGCSILSLKGEVAVCSPLLKARLTNKFSPIEFIS